MIQILPLTGSHDRKSFDCGQQELNSWLQKIALQHQKKGISKTFVAIRKQEPTDICGYYALTLTEVDTRELPEKRRAKLPRTIPGIRLGRLAVSRKHQGKHLGQILLMNAIERVQLIREHAGAVGLFVDTIDEQAKGFYIHYGFESFADEPCKLFYPVGGKDSSES